MGQLGLGIVEADPGLARRLAGFFAEHGFVAEHHEDSKSLLARLPVRPPAMVLLGRVPPPGTALGTLRRLREASQVPCIVMAEERDAVCGIVVLDAGADDMVDRAMPLRAVLARVRAVLRRAEWGTVATDAVIAAGGWRLVPQRRQLLRPDGAECVLTTAEFDLMALLMDRRGRPVAREDIAQAVFRRPFRAEDRTVDNLVLRLRRKLGAHQQNSIKTVRGAGYMFAGFVESGLKVA